MFRVFAVLLGALAAYAQATPQVPPAQMPRLRVLSSIVNLETHWVPVELQNPGDKTVTAYALEFKESDASGKIISDSRVGWDHVYYKPTGTPIPEYERDLIPPGKTITRHEPTSSDATTSEQITVLAVVYDDRTWEGKQKDAFPLFDIRSRLAQKLKQASALMQQAYPATPTEFRDKIQALRAIEPSRVSGMLYEKFKVSPEIAIDSKHALPESVPMPSREQWGSAAQMLSDEAAFWMAESQEAQQ